MAGRITRTLSVIRKEALTPNMKRLILGGKALADFPEGQESGYVKMCFYPTNTHDIENQKPRVRSYTIRAFDLQKQELTLDFVAHGDNGLASAWANRCEVGDTITIDGPGAVKLVDTTADWFLLAGDMTAIPAISVNLEKLPAQAKGYAVIEILSEADKQHLIAPKDIQIKWVINPHPDQENTLLVDAVKSLPWLEGVPSIWCASEFEAMRNIRRYCKQQRHVERDQLYASSYWKMGTTDEGNKAAKRADVEAL